METRENGLSDEPGQLPESPHGGLKVKRVGIAVATYEPVIDFFAEQLESLQSQTFTDWTCAVIFDSPMSPVLADPRMKAFREDARFHWVENPARLGLKKNFENAIGILSAADVDAIACADQDDVWYPEKLAVSIDALEKAGPLSLVHCDMHVDPAEPRTAWQIELRGVHNVSYEHLLIRNVVAGAGMLFDARLARMYPEIPDGFGYHDHWYALVASCFGGVHAIRRPLYHYRQHRSNTVGITPFQGTFRLPRGIRHLQVPKECREKWETSRRLALAAWRAGLHERAPTGSAAAVSRRDLGLGFLARALAHWRDDRALARAYLARSLGKALHGIAPVFPAVASEPGARSAAKPRAARVEETDGVKLQPSVGRT